MLALIISARGGFIPQAWQGERGVCWFAKAGSKLEGTLLDKPQIGHIHVALVFLAGNGEATGGREVDDPERTSPSMGEAYLGCGLLTWGPVRCILGKRVIFAEDFKKPA